jgi:hypothetical protein
VRASANLPAPGKVVLPLREDTARVSLFTQQRRGAKMATQAYSANVGGFEAPAVSRGMGLLNETQAADLLNIKVPTLRRWRWAGKGPTFLKIGGAVR